MIIIYNIIILLARLGMQNMHEIVIAQNRGSGSHGGRGGKYVGILLNSDRMERVKTETSYGVTGKL